MPTQTPNDLWNFLSSQGPETALTIETVREAQRILAEIAPQRSTLLQAQLDALDAHHCAFRIAMCADSPPVVTDMLSGEATPVPRQDIPADHFECEHCNVNAHNDDRYETTDSGDICVGCVVGGDFVVVAGDGVPTLTANCTRCRECNDWAHDADICSVDGRDVCRSCMETSDDIVMCSDDDAYHYRDNVYYHDSDDNWRTYAEDEESDSEDSDDSDSEHETENVYNYSVNVLNVLGRCCFVKKQRAEIGKQLLFGVELETDTKSGRERDRDGVAEAVLGTDFSRYGICKADGTVSGPELVTLPADLESHRKLYRWDKWIKAIQPLAKGFYGESCGMHVHINRAALSPLTVGKMLVFMNLGHNHKWLEMIAQRPFTANTYCKPKNDKRLTDARDGACNSDRYECLNVTRRTVEVRIFKSNLHAERLIKNIEFCHALTQWARDASASELTWQQCEAYILENRGMYPALVKFIISKKTIETTEEA